MGTEKPTLNTPTSLGKQYEKKFSSTMNKNNVKLNEVDNLLTEKEQSLKKKIFSLSKMESLVFSDPKLSIKYEKMAETGEEKFGYHYNETIMNILFNQYVLNDKKYLQKYINAIPKKKKRRDKSGINQLKHSVDGSTIKENIEMDEPDYDNDCFIKSNGFKYSVSCSGKHIGDFDEMDDSLYAVSEWKKQNRFYPNTWYVSDHGNITLIDDDGNIINETTSASSAGGDAGYVGYAGPSAWSKKGDLLGDKGKPARKPIWTGGSIINETNYLTDPKGFEIFNKILNENTIDDKIVNDTTAFNSSTVKNWSDGDKKIEINTLKSGNTEQLNEKAVSKSQQRFMGMVRAVQKGELSKDKVSDDVVKAAESMKKKDVKDFASTKHKKLPEKVDESLSEMGMKKYNQKGYIFYIVNPSTNKIESGWEFKEDAIDRKNEIDIPVKVFSKTFLMSKGINPDDNNNWGGINEETNLSMIQDNPTTMANKVTQTSMETGMNTSSSPVNESVNMIDDIKFISELNDELEAYKIHDEKLRKMNEERRISSLVVKDRLGNENQKNFKSDMNNSGTKEIINVEKELQYKDQQTEVKDPQKNGLDIEKQVKENSLKNVGNSDGKNNEIPKRNLTKEEQDEVNLYRNGMHSIKYDNEPSEKFTERAKDDMGDFYEMGQKQLKDRSNMSMYNKDAQPVYNDKKPTNLNETLSGKYINSLNKRALIDFYLNESIEITNENIDQLFKIDFTGMGNGIDKKGNINESINFAMNSFDYYTDGKKVYYSKKNNMLNENKNVEIKTNFDKIKHLTEYNPNTFVNTNNIKKNRGF